jgi:hypothetical protein
MIVDLSPAPQHGPGSSMSARITGAGQRVSPAVVRRQPAVELQFRHGIDLTGITTD